jgi:hypothetical protein
MPPNHASTATSRNPSPDNYGLLRFDPSVPAATSGPLPSSGASAESTPRASSHLPVYHERRSRSAAIRTVQAVRCESGASRRTTEQPRRRPDCSIAPGATSREPRRRRRVGLTVAPKSRSSGGRPGAPRCLLRRAGTVLSKQTSRAAAHRSSSVHTRGRAAAAAQKQRRDYAEPCEAPDDRIPPESDRVNLPTAGDAYGDLAIARPPPAALSQCHGSDSRVGPVVLTAADRRIVRSPQPAAADRRPAPHPAALPRRTNLATSVTPISLCCISLGCEVVPGRPSAAARARTEPDP